MPAEAKHLRGEGHLVGREVLEPEALDYALVHELREELEGAHLPGGGRMSGCERSRRAREREREEIDGAHLRAELPRAPTVRLLATFQQGLEHPKPIIVLVRPKVTSGFCRFGEGICSGVE